MRDNRQLLLEDKRSELLSQSKKGANYVPWNQFYGKNRYQRRLKSKIAPSIKHFNNIDMNKFFKTDILDVLIDVKGETNIYKVRMSFVGTLDEIHNELNKSSGAQIDRKIVLRALTKAFNKDNVYINCTCPDFCLHPNTQIKLLNCETISVEDMFNRFKNGEKFWVYSTDDKGDFKPGLVEDVWITGKSKDFIRVTLDNNEEILTTPNHLYMMRDGSYKEAKDLEVGQSLMPLYFSYHNGYENVKSNSESTTSFYSVYKSVANELLQNNIKEAKIRSGEEHIAIHHKDYNKLNNNPENLYPMGVQEHWHFHHEHVRESGALDKWLEAGRRYWSTQEARDKQALLMSEVMTNYYANRTPEEIERDALQRSKTSKEAWERGCFNTEKWKRAAKERGIQMHTPEKEAITLEGIHKYWENISTEEKERRSNISRENQKKAAEEVKGKPFTEEHKRKISEAYRNKSEKDKKLHQLKIRDSKILTVLNKILSDGKLVTFDNYYKYRKSGYPDIKKYFSTEKELIDYFSLDDRYNHKIINIEYISLDEEIPIYDIQVKDYHNFLVGAGVVLHNCYRFKYWATKKNLLIGDPENRPAKITNPTDDKGPGCKHIILCLSDASWLIKIASVIYNYVTYMQQHEERLFQRYIFPAVYGKPYDEYQMSIWDQDEEELASEEGDIEAANVAARRRGQFKKGNEYRFRKEEPGEDNQITFDELENELADEESEEI